MIEDTIAALESAVAKIKDADPAKRAELTRLLGALKTDIRRMQGAQADPQLVKRALDGLMRSEKDFETSHPNLAAAIDAICRELASLGI